MSEGGREAVRTDDAVAPAAELRRLEARVRDLERLLGRKTMENEILKEALDLARAKKAILLSSSAPPDGSRSRRSPTRWALPARTSPSGQRVCGRNAGHRTVTATRNRAPISAASSTRDRPTGTGGSPRY
jgi:hypothetical protein